MDDRLAHSAFDRGGTADEGREQAEDVEGGGSRRREGQWVSRCLAELVAKTRIMTLSARC